MSKARETMHTHESKDSNENTACRLKGMENIIVAKVEGVNYAVLSKVFAKERNESQDDVARAFSGTEKGRYMTDEDSVTIIKRMRLLIKELQIRNDDILLVGFPRCGCHWIFEVICMILQNKVGYIERTLEEASLEGVEFRGQKPFDDLESPRILQMHSRLSYLPQQILEKSTKVVFLVRNPKDALVSLYKIFIEFKMEGLRFTGSWEDFFKAHMSGEFVWGTIIDYYLDAEAFRRQNPHCPIYVHSFEKHKADPVQQIRELCAFLGKSDHLAEKIASATGIDDMKKGVEKKVDVFKKVLFNDSATGVIVKGQTGGWKDWFTVSQSEEFNRVFDQKLAGTEIGALVNSYIR